MLGFQDCECACSLVPLTEWQILHAWSQIQHPHPSKRCPYPWHKLHSWAQTHPGQTTRHGGTRLVPFSLFSGNDHSFPGCCYITSWYSSPVFVCSSASFTYPSVHCGLLSYPLCHDGSSWNERWPDESWGVCWSAHLPSDECSSSCSVWTPNGNNFSCSFM